MYTLQIQVGAHNFSDPDENVLEIFDVAEIIVHPDWDPDVTQNDIALLRLNDSVIMTENITGICPPSTDDYEGERSLVSGWGALNYVIDPGN